MEGVLNRVLDRFPSLGKKIFNQLDNQNLTKCKTTARSFNEFLKNDKVLWTRMIKKYNVSHQEFKDDWKSVMEKVPVEIVKELALAVEQFYTLRPHQARFNHQHSPHHIAAKRGSLSLCKFIARKTKSLNPARADGMTALHFAVQEGHFDVCKYFVDNLDGDKNPANHNGRTPLHDAAFQGNLAVFKYIADQVDNKNPAMAGGRTPLHNAVANGRIQIVKCILDFIDEKDMRNPLLSSMDKNVKDDAGLTPMHMAVRQENYEICKLFVDHGADPNPRTYGGFSALDMAGANREIQDLILKNPKKIKLQE